MRKNENLPASNRAQRSAKRAGSDCAELRALESAEEERRLEFAIFRMRAGRASPAFKYERFQFGVKVAARRYCKATRRNVDGENGYFQIVARQRVFHTVRPLDKG